MRKSILISNHADVQLFAFRLLSFSINLSGTKSIHVGFGIFLKPCTYLGQDVTQYIVALEDRIRVFNDLVIAPPERFHFTDEQHTLFRFSQMPS